MSGYVSGIVSLVLLVLFIAGWAWAWSSKRRTTFDAAARLPLEEDNVQRPGDAARGAGNDKGNAA